MCHLCADVSHLLTWAPLLGATDFLSMPCFLQVTLMPTSQVCSILLEFSTALSCSIAACLHAWMVCQSARCCDWENHVPAKHKLCWCGLHNVVWNVHLIAQAAALNTFPKGSSLSESLSSNSWVRSMSFKTWWILSTTEFD